MSSYESILLFIRTYHATQVPYQVLKEHFSHIAESTLVRNLNKLIEQGKLKKSTHGRQTSYTAVSSHQSIRDYLSRMTYERKRIAYNPEFLNQYVPGASSFFNPQQKQLIKASLQEYTTLQTVDYQTNIRGIENMLIDLSYMSSSFEGNTYSYLDTEVLIKYNEVAQDKTTQETQMILNHKEAIRYCIDNRSRIKRTMKTLCEVHMLLAKGLLSDGHLGTVRQVPVQIGGSTYEPLAGHQDLLDVLTVFLEKLIHITDPFEQSIFILAFVSYFQAFIDVNKRTARICANIPLLQHGLPILSFLQAKKKDYILAILAVYELNDVSLLAELYINNYLLNMKRYLPPQ